MISKNKPFDKDEARKKFINEYAGKHQSIREMKKKLTKTELYYQRQWKLEKKCIRCGELMPNWKQRYCSEVCRREDKKVIKLEKL